MSEWSAQFPVNFTEDGDRTNLAISKHINEIARLYGLIAQLRNNFSGAGFPSGPVRNQLYINPNTFAAKVFVGLSGEDDWRDVTCVPAKHDLDKHNAGVMQDLQDLVSDAFLLYLATAPGAADNGKVLAVNSAGKVAAAVCPVTDHGPEKHTAGTLAQARALISDGWLVALAAAPLAADAGKVLAVNNDGAVALSDVVTTQAATIATLNAAIVLINQSLANLTARVLALETAMPKLESVAALPASPDADTWYFVQEAAS